MTATSAAVDALASQPTASGSPHGAGRRGRGPATTCSASRTPRGLVEGRAGDQRHHGRRGPAAAPVPRHPHRRRDRARPAGWIRSQQRADGTWATFYGGPGDLSTTIEAYVALRLAGDPAGRPAHGARAAACVREHGGIEASRVFTRIWLALFGGGQWDDLPVMPPELILLPKWFPLNVYDWACWARQTIVPLTIVGALRPVRPLRLRRCTGAARPAPGQPRAAVRRWAGFFQRARQGAARLRRGAPVRPAAATRRMRRAADWILARQEADGCWGGIQPPWVYSLIALHLLGYALDHPVMREGSTGWTASPSVSDATDGPAARGVPVPGVGHRLAITALLDAGVPGRPPGAAQGRRLAARRGDHAARRLVGAPARPGARRLGVRVRTTTTTPTPTTPPRSCSRCAASRTRTLPRRDPARRRRGWTGHAVAGTAAGARSTPTTPARCAPSCRSATSAR